MRPRVRSMSIKCFFYLLIAAGVKSVITKADMSFVEGKRKCDKENSGFPGVAGESRPSFCVLRSPPIPVHVGNFTVVYYKKKSSEICAVGGTKDCETSRGSQWRKRHEAWASCITNHGSMRPLTIRKATCITNASRFSMVIWKNKREHAHAMKQSLS